MSKSTLIDEMVLTQCQHLDNTINKLLANFQRIFRSYDFCSSFRNVIGMFLIVQNTSGTVNKTQIFYTNEDKSYSFEVSMWSIDTFEIWFSLLV